jgi:hypothetical protein
MEHPRNREVRRAKNKKLDIRKEKKTPSVEELLQKAEELAENFEFDLAENFYQRAFDMQPTNTSIIDAFAFIKIELDKMDEAKQVKILSTASRHSSHSAIVCCFCVFSS